MTRVERTQVCTCSQEDITPDMDDKEALRIYTRAVRCQAHRYDGSEKPFERTPEEASKIYHEFMAAVRSSM